MAHLPAVGEKFLFKAGKHITAKISGDFVDNLTSRYTPCLFMLIAFWVSYVQLRSDPMVCLVPSEYKDNREIVRFVHDYCSSNSLEYTEIKQSGNNRVFLDQQKRQTIAYYQWVPLVIVIMCLVFYFPRAIWNFAGATISFRLNNILRYTRYFKHACVINMAVTLNTMVKWLTKSELF